MYSTPLQHARMGQGAGNLQNLAPKCAIDCPLYASPDDAATIVTVVPRGTTMKLVGQRLPDWLEVIYTYPGNQGLQIVNAHGWIRTRDLRARPGGTPSTNTTPAGGTTPGGGGATTAAAGASSALKTLGEVVLLTSPAWGAVLLTRLMR